MLAHRPSAELDEVVDRFVAAGIRPEDVAAVLADSGDRLYAAASTAADSSAQWAEPFGGPLAAALLAAESSALAAHLNSRASAVRSLAVDALMDEYSAVSVAAGLGVSRQKVYDIGRPSPARPFITTVPWRRP